MGKLEDLKEAVKNPPPERLAAIEYRSHFLQMLGITIVCIVLIAKGFWYIIFAFVFGVGISYSQGMSAYAKYKMINSLISKPNPLNYDSDISPTRRRSKIIQHVFGKKARWISIFISVLVPLFIINPITSRWYFSIAYLLTLIAVYILVYFFVFFWIAYPFYKKEIEIKGKAK